jgi:hypothetical protein
MGIVTITIIVKQVVFTTCAQLEAMENKVGVVLDKGFVFVCGL